MLVTSTGKAIDIPKESDINILDIAQGLSNICRFGGQCKFFYSVAEHSVLLSRLVDNPIDAKILLLHDASEAYLGDVVRGLKSRPEFEGYLKLEKVFNSTIMSKFGLDIQFPEHLKDLDDRAIANEIRFLFDVWPVEVKYDIQEIPGFVLKCWSPFRAGLEFLRRYMELFHDA